MKEEKKIIKFTIFSIVFVAILGTLLHFTFEWSNYNPFVAAFSAVNESTWEHLKILFVPMLITSIIGYFYLGKNVSSYLCARVFAIITALLFTTVFFYTYTGIIGSNITILNLLSFYFAIILGEYISYRFMLSNLTCNKSKAIIFLVILTLCFVIFTYLTPQIVLFKDPLTNGYGIVRKS